MTAVDTDLRALSVNLEAKTGFDSIPTIERIYARNEAGAPPYDCPFPHCAATRRDPVEMWRHVHFGRKHPLSFGVTNAALLGGAS
jgi:hypothetical protein